MLYFIEGHFVSRSSKYLLYVWHNLCLMSYVMTVTHTSLLKFIHEESLYSKVQKLASTTSNVSFFIYITNQYSM